MPEATTAAAPASSPAPSTGGGSGSNPASSGNTSPNHTSSPSTGGSATGLKQSAGVGATPPENKSPVSQELPQWIEKKINGKMVRMTPQEADDYLSMSYAATERFKEAAKIRKEHEAREAQYSKNPVQAFLDYAQKANLSEDQIRDHFEKYYADKWLKTDNLSPKEKELLAREEAVKKWEADRQSEQERLYASNQQKALDQDINNVSQEIIGALEKSGLPAKNKFLFQRMAAYMLENNQNGWNAPPETIMRQVVNEHKGIVGTFLQDASIEQIIDYAGQEFIDRVLKHSLDALRNKRQQRQEPFVGTQGNAALNPNEKIDYSEVNRRLRDMRSGKFMSNS